MVLDSALRSTILLHLQRFERVGAQHAAHPRSAVALTLVDAGPGAGLPGFAEPTHWSNDAALLLTRRARHLRRHPGQWALPGGKVDAGESAEQTALRELREEVGLHLTPEAVLGHLDDFVTRSGFVIEPVVVWAGAVSHLQPNPGEVDSVHRIPLTELLRPSAPILEPSSDDPDRPLLFMPLGDSWIASPTAALLYQFREVGLRGQSVRVAHYEQPLFARS